MSGGGAAGGGGPDSPEADSLTRSATSAGGHGSRSTDWFDLDVSVTVDEQDVPLRELIVALTTGQEVLVLPSGTWLRLDDERLIALAAILREAADLQDEPDGPLRVNALHAGLWDELVELVPQRALGLSPGFEVGEREQHALVVADLDRLPGDNRAPLATTRQLQHGLHLRDSAPLLQPLNGELPPGTLAAGELSGCSAAPG